MVHFTSIIPFQSSTFNSSNISPMHSHSLSFRALVRTEEAACMHTKGLKKFVVLPTARRKREFSKEKNEKWH
jgi:hypothetical protein